MGACERIGVVQAKHAGAVAFHVVAYSPKDDGTERPLAGVWFVEPKGCKVVGLNDCAGTSCYRD